jgi:thioester reductase-like protein
LIRAENESIALRRLISHLESYGLWRAGYAPRVVPVVGDLAEPRFGLGRERYEELADAVDVIFHSAGWINMFYPYSRLKPTNVNGVLEALRFAAHGQTKPFHFVSSVAIFYSDVYPSGRVLTESALPEYHASLKGGYGKSKWVADRLVAAAQKRGLPASIYRPIRIMGHSRSGALNDTTEILPQLLKACIKMGRYPAWNIEVTLVPVDYISRSMVHLAKSSANWGKAFHFFNRHPIRWRDLMEIFVEHGYPMTEMPCDQWRQELKSHATSTHSGNQEDKQLYSKLMLALVMPHYLFYQRPPFDTGNIDEALRDSDIFCPPVDESLIARYISYWQASGFLPAPIAAVA